MKRSKIIITICIIVILIGIINIIKLLKTRDVTIQIEESLAPKSKGNPGARIKIEEYSDFQCLSCAECVKILKEYTTAHPQEIYVKFNHFPRPSHPHAFKLAVYAECAAKQNKFWELHDAFFKQRVRIKGSTKVEPVLEEIAEKVGLDMEKFRMCIKDKKIAAAIEAEVAKGKSRGVRSTPTYFINGKMVVGIFAFMNEMYELLEGTDREKP